jgi:hypothetical protein
MVKKNFGQGIDAILNNPKTNQKKKEKSKLVRTTLLISKELLEQIRAIAYWERTTLKHFIEKSFNNSLSQVDKRTMDEALQEYKKYSQNNS